MRRYFGFQVFFKQCQTVKGEEYAHLHLMAAVVEARMNGGYAQSNVSLEAMSAILFCLSVVSLIVLSSFS